MFDRVVMKVFHMILKILLVTNQMFPIPSLPDRLFPLALARWAVLFRSFDGISGEMAFNQPPARSEIVVTGWQRPNGVQVVRQDDQRVDAKRMVAYGVLKAGLQPLDGRSSG